MGKCQKKFPKKKNGMLQWVLKNKCKLVADSEPGLGVKIARGSLTDSLGPTLRNSDLIVLGWGPGSSGDVSVQAGVRTLQSDNEEEKGSRKVKV